MQKSYFIHTFGCQMNEHDSSRMGESLSRAGWARTDSADAADLVLLNTCAIREKAEDKLYSALGRYRMVKARRGARIGVAGCVAQQEKEKLINFIPPEYNDQTTLVVDVSGPMTKDFPLTSKK